jgi:hypothetical protein
MGMERVVEFGGPEPSWAAVREKLAARGLTPQMRMIDGLPALPDEEPEANWRELRVAFDGGMVTLRREPGRFRVVVWGNADGALRRDQETIAAACAEAGGGTVV